MSRIAKQKNQARRVQTWGPWMANWKISAVKMQQHLFQLWAFPNSHLVRRGEAERRIYDHLIWFLPLKSFSHRFTFSVLLGEVRASGKFYFVKKTLTLYLKSPDFYFLIPLALPCWRNSGLKEKWRTTNWGGWNLQSGIFLDSTD